MQRISDGRRVVVLFAFLSLFFVPWWIQGQVYGTFDLAHTTIPIEDLFARYQRMGELPLWTPEFQGGFPMMANGFQSILYPPHAVLRAFLSGVWVANISLLLHLWLAAIGMVFLLRRQGYGPTAVMVGTLAFSAGGYLLGRITLPHLFFPAAWIPFILAFFLETWRRPTVRSAALFAMSVGAQVFAGHIQMVFYTALILALTTLILLFETPWRTSLRRIPLLFLLGGGIWLLSAVHLLPVYELLPLSKRSKALTGVEAFDVSYPLRHLLTVAIPDSFGSGATYTGAKNEPELATSFGVIGTVLLLVALISPSTWTRTLGRLGIVLTVVGLVLAGGAFSPVFRFLHASVPLLAQFANPGRAIILAFVGGTLLIASGIEDLFHWERRQRRAMLFIAISMFIFVVGSVLASLPVHERHAVIAQLMHTLPLLAVIIPFFALCVFVSRPAPRIRMFLVLLFALELLSHGIRANPHVTASLFQTPLRAASVLPARADAPRIYSHVSIVPVPHPSGEDVEVGMPIARDRDARQSLIPQRDTVEAIRVSLTWNGKQPTDGTITLILEDGAGQVLRTVHLPPEALGNEEPVRFSFPPLEGVRGIPLAFRLESSYISQKAPHVFLHTNEGAADFQPTGIAEECRNDRCVPTVTQGTAGHADLAFDLLYRDAPVLPKRELLIPIFGEGLGYQMIRGHMTLQLQRIVAYLHEIGEGGETRSGNLITHRDLLDRLSIGTIVSSYPEHRGLQGLPSVTLRMTAPLGERELHVYENTQAYPRIHLARHAVTETDPEQVIPRLRDGTVPRDTVIVEQSSLPENVGRDTTSTLVTKRDTPTKIEVGVTSTSSQLLVVRDTWFPGWEARIDESPTSVLRADALFRAIIVPPGTHTIELSYHPPAFLRGALVSLPSWVLGFGLILIPGRRLSPRFRRWFV